MKKKKKVWLSLLLSFILPSLGQFYNRQLRKGFLFLIILVFLSLVQRLALPAPLTEPLLGLIFIFSIYIILDAYEEARKINKEKPLSGARKMLVALTVTLCFLGTRIPVIFLANNITENMSGLKAYYISNTSMEPTLKKGDRLLFDTLVYKGKKPQRGDLVIFQDPRNPQRVYLKRVIALEGEEIEIKKGKVYIQDKSFQEPYLKGKILEDFKPLKVPLNSLFLLGDNRNQCIDSRHLGPIRLKNILGKAARIYWPLKRRRKL
jgi:signal peptidase I